MTENPSGKFISKFNQGMEQRRSGYAAVAAR
jgi:hypothetical protein